MGSTETGVKHRFNNHTKSFNLEHYENDTGLSKEFWTIKGNNFIPKVTWRNTHLSIHQKENVICALMQSLR